MKVKKIPMRTCVVTKEKYPKKELLRIVRCDDNLVKVDITGKINGHGAYIKKDMEVLSKAKKTKVLERYLECAIPDSVYEEIKSIIEN